MNIRIKMNWIFAALSIFSLNCFAATSTALSCDLTTLHTYPNSHTRAFAAARQWVIRTANINQVVKGTAQIRDGLPASGASDPTLATSMLDTFTAGKIAAFSAATPLADCVDLALIDSQFRMQEFGDIGIVKYADQELVAIKVREPKSTSLLIVYPLTTLIYDLDTQQLTVYNNATRTFEPLDLRSRRSFSYTIFQIKQDLGIQ